MVSTQAATYTVERLTVLGEEDSARLEDVQQRALSMLHSTSAVDHVLKDFEVEAFAGDERLLKFVIRHEGDLVGVFAVSRRPSDGWEHLSDGFFEARYPGAIDDGRFAYLAGSFVAPEHQGQGAYAAVIKDVYDWIEQEKIVVFSGDMAAVNFQWMIPMFERSLIDRFGYSDHELVDTHHFSTFRFRHDEVEVDLRSDDVTVTDTA